MPASRRKFDEEFKKKAVKISYASSKTIKDVARDLGIQKSVLYRWRRQYTSQGDQTQASVESPSETVPREEAETPSSQLTSSDDSPLPPVFDSGQPSEKNEKIIG